MQLKAFFYVAQGGQEDLVDPDNCPLFIHITVNLLFELK